MLETGKRAAAAHPSPAAERPFLRIEAGAAGDGAVRVAQVPPVLAEVQYHMRLKGFMRPRKCVPSTASALYAKALHQQAAAATPSSSRQPAL
jgi:hypothetical protein